MTTSWGIDPLKDAETGAVLLGTTAADFRQIQGGLYSPGLISGGVVTRSSSDMTYSVSGGVAAYPIITSGVPETVLGPVPAQVVTTTAAVSGTRLDMVYAKQRTVAVDGDPNIIIEVGTFLPDRAVLLDAFLVTTTTSSTMSAVRQADIKYSVPYGAVISKPFFTHRSAYNGTFTSTKQAAAAGSFYMPMDRLVSVRISTSLSANGAGGFDNSKYCEAAYAVYIDDVWRWTWTSHGLHQAWSEHFWEENIQISQGSHTIRVDRWRSVGPGTPVQRYGQGNLGLLCEIRDAGPVA